MLTDQHQERFADIDGEALGDTLQGLSDFPGKIAEIVRSGRDDEALIAGLKMRLDATGERPARFKHASSESAHWLAGRCARHDCRGSTKTILQYSCPSADKSCLACVRITVRAGNNTIVREGTGFGGARALLRVHAHECALKDAA